MRVSAWVVMVVGLACGLPVGRATGGELNDTGVVSCIGADRQWATTCAGTGQDGELGRDVSLPNALDGQAGFSYTKICNMGAAAGVGQCPVEPKIGPGPLQWGCTLDRVTGLMWEVKVDKPGHFRDQNLVYTNTRPDQKGFGQAGDAKGFVDRVNSVTMCGATDWRMPSVQELLSLVNFGRPSPALVIDPVYFPNTMPGLYWTSTGYIERKDDAWYVVFVVGQSFPDGRLGRFYVRLVRS